jgi:hypothetical protein
MDNKAIKPLFYRDLSIKITKDDKCKKISKVSGGEWVESGWRLSGIL